MNMDHGTMGHGDGPKPSRPEVVAVALLSFAILAAGVWLANRHAFLTMSTRTMRQDMQFDRLYIDMMAPHHQAAVEMARLEIERGTRPELKAFAERIVRDQAAEIAEMKGYRKSWYGSADTPDMSDMPMVGEGMAMGADMPMDMRGDLETLRRDPREFDLAFLEAMIPHHGSAVEASAHAPTLAVHPETVGLARRIADGQAREIDQMRRWRAAWFPGR